MTIAGGAKRPWTMPAPAALIPVRPASECSEQPNDRAGLVRAVAEARTALEQAALAAAIAAQRARSVATALDEALEVVAVREDSTAARPPVNDGLRHTAALSPREQEVLTLVAEGHSNKAIAAALYVSPNTVKTHVASLLHKLHADSRTQLAALAARQGLFLSRDAYGSRLQSHANGKSPRPFLRP